MTSNGTGSGLLTGKTIVLMGVANKWSIAYGIGQQLLEHGATLAVSYLDERMKRDAEALIADSPNSRLYPCNVESDEDLDALRDNLAADFGTIHGYVHSVAFAPKEEMQHRFLETTKNGFNIAMNISVYSLISTSQRIVPLMTEGGSILTLTYIASERAFPRYNVMGIAKAALESTVRFLAYDLGNEGIRVNAISAGPISSASARGIPGFTDMLGYFRDVAPIKTPLTNQNVGDLAVFLASDLSSAITGETIFVDNGFHAIGMAPPPEK